MSERGRGKIARQPRPHAPSGGPMIAGNTALAEYGANGPDLAPIIRIHRHEGRVVFARNGDFTKAIAVDLHDLATWFPAWRDELLRDSYFDINGYSIDVKKRTDWNVRDAKRRTDWNVSYLTACWVDIDRTEGRTVSDMLHAINLAAESGAIPHPSITVKSGRGAWALWLLESPAGGPELVTPDLQYRKELQRSVNRTIGERIQAVSAGLNVDYSTVNAARNMRVPGSVNSKAGLNVIFSFHAAPERPGGLVYTLDELAQWVGLSAERPLPRERRAPSPDRPDKKPRVWGQRRVNELERLIQHRSPITEGMRHEVIFNAARVYRAAGSEFPDTLDHILKLAQNHCRPPYPANEATAQVKSVYSKEADMPAFQGAKQKRYWISNHVLASSLKVTQAEIQTLGLKSITPEYVSGRHEGKGQKAEKAARLEFIRALNLESTPGWSTTTMRAKLKAAGFICSHGTVIGMLRELGIQTPEAKARAAAGKERAGVIPLF